MSTFTTLFSTWDLSVKTGISFSCGFVCGLSYYVIGKLEIFLNVLSLTYRLILYNIKLLTNNYDKFVLLLVYKNVLTLFKRLYWMMSHKFSHFVGLIACIVISYKLIITFLLVFSLIIHLVSLVSYELWCIIIFKYS